MVSHCISWINREVNDYDFLLDADIILGDGSYSDILALSYCDTGMSEIYRV